MISWCHIAAHIHDIIKRLIVTTEIPRERERESCRGKKKIKEREWASYGYRKEKNKEREMRVGDEEVLTSTLLPATIMGYEGLLTSMTATNIIIFPSSSSFSSLFFPLLPFLSLFFPLTQERKIQIL